MTDDEYFEHIKKRDAEQAKRDEEFQKKMEADMKHSAKEIRRTRQGVLVFWLLFLFVMLISALLRYFKEGA